MGVRGRLKEAVERAPPSVGLPLSRVPFSLRLGTKYWSTAKIIDAWGKDPSAISGEYFQKLRSLVIYAFEDIDFYREFYRSKGFSPQDLNSMSDWKTVPIVTKGDLQKASLVSRCSPEAKGMKINTGGTSGQPLEFYLDSGAFAREWAHLHHIWRRHGYRQQHLKLTFRGKHFHNKKPLRYNAVHNEFVVNASAPMSQVVSAVMELSNNRIIRWLHGYPSLISEFAREIEREHPSGFSGFRARLFGVLLGSEYPAPIYRSVIERVLTTHVVSWYGHSEMAILAPETSLGIYQSFPTYGYAEAVATDDGQSRRLICTSLYNRKHPFIRYDTGDLIEEVSLENYSLGFRIQEGRVGDFIIDHQGNAHSLTAIIFGRHHEAFDLLNHVQVRDEGHGVITFVLTPRDADVDPKVLEQGFNLQDLDMEFRFEVVDSPIRTAAGKIKLKL